MYVKNSMTVDPYTIDANAPITDVIELMRENDLKRIPVVEDGKAVGIITNSDIRKVSPTQLTSLSVFEINYLLSKTIVKDAMNKDVKTISPDALLEEAAVLMRMNRLSTLVVVDGEHKVVGIITESNIFDAFIELLGFRESGTRISIEAEDMPGVLADIGRIFSEHNANITHIADFSRGNSKAEIIVRTSSLNTDDIQKSIKDAGYEILSIMRNEN